MRNFIILVLMVTLGWGAEVSTHIWEKGQTFSNYLESRQISCDILGQISKEDEQFLTEIQSKSTYYELIDRNGVLVQALIPINQEMQIHLFRDRKSGIYGFNIIPIVYEENEYFAKVNVTSNPYSDTLLTVKEEKVAKRLGQTLKGTIDNKRLKKNDQITFVYNQKTRLGKLYAMPDIKVASVSSKGKTKFIYADEEGYGHLEGDQRTEFAKNGDFIHLIPQKDRSKRLGMPLRHVRITSHFSLRRWHPVLKGYRPHQGTDFGARKGTPLLSVYDGTVSFAGWMNGYGNVVKIRHAMGYESLYAHQSRIKARRGQKVKKGDIIGYVGNTGRSTGPHLHFGLQRYGRWVDPMKHLQRASLDKEKYVKVVIKDAKAHKEKLMEYINEDRETYVWEKESSQAAIGG